MSLIPQRKHTPEELAALRAQEFSHFPPPVPVAPIPVAESHGETIEAVVETPRYTPPVKHGTYHGFEGLRPDAAVLPPPSQATTGQHAVLPSAHASATVCPSKTVRKVPPQKHGALHAFDGLRPEAAAGMTSGQSAPSAALPQRKHDEKEIMEMRRRDMFHTRPPVQHIRNMALNPILGGILYTSVIATIYLTFHYWNAFPPQKFYAPATGCSVLLLASLLIYWKKPRGRHHAAFLAGIAIILASFVILLTTNHHAP